MKKIKVSNANISFFYVFLVVSIILLCGGLTFGIYYGYSLTNYQETQAVITEIEEIYDAENNETDHRVFVSYNFNGTSYENVSLGYWQTGYRVGDEITIYCNKNSPTDIMMREIVIIVPIVLLGMGAIFFLLSIFPIIKHHKKQKVNKNLMKTGKVIKCKVSSVFQDTSYKMNGVFVNRIAVCVPLDQSIVFEFKSLPFNRKYNLPLESVVDVYYEDEHFDNYYVDLSSARFEKTSKIEKSS